MQTTIKQVSPVEYELEITATADDLAPELNKALKAQQKQTQMKGFRVGKVPISIVKKRFGEALAYGIADRSIQETFNDEVLQNDAYEVLGQPVITKLDYEMDSDLHAIVQFGVRPDVELQDLSDAEVTKLVHEVTDEEVDEEIDRLLRDNADLMPVEDEPVGDADLIVFDLQELDAETRTPIIGKRDEGQSMFLDDPRVEDNLMLSALADAVKGKHVGDTVRFSFEHDKAHDDHDEGHSHAHYFEATIKEVKRRDLPELDDEFVEDLTNGQIEDVETFRAEVQKQIENAWAQRSQEVLEGTIMERMMDLHPVDVPNSVIEIYLDSFVEDVKRRNDGDLPENFPVEAFRNANRDEAEKQARWMLIRDKVVEDAGLEVTDEDRTAFFQKEADKDGRITAEQMQQFYQAMPQLKEQLEQRLLSQRVFDHLAGQMNVVEKDRETFERELEEREQAAQAE